LLCASHNRSLSLLDEVFQVLGLTYVVRWPRRYRPPGVHGCGDRNKLERALKTIQSRFRDLAEIAISP